MSKRRARRLRGKSRGYLLTDFIPVERLQEYANKCAELGIRKDLTHIMWRHPVSQKMVRTPLKIFLEKHRQ